MSMVIKSLVVKITVPIGYDISLPFDLPDNCLESLLCIEVLK